METGDIIVLMCRGPLGSGMEEIYQITSALKHLSFGKHVAVLTDAVATFRRLDGIENPRARRLFAEAEAWFASDEADGPFTFVTVCDSLGLDPSCGQPLVA